MMRSNNSMLYIGMIVFTLIASVRFYSFQLQCYSNQPQHAEYPQRILPKIQLTEPISNAIEYVYPLLEDQIEELLTRVDKKHHSRCRSFFTGVNVQSAAQQHQDWFLFANFFYKLGTQPGVFLDIGGNDPVKVSNTYFYEICLGWQGVVIEPNSRYWKRYADIRNKSRVVPNCIDTKPGKKELLSQRRMGRLVDENENVSTTLENSALATNVSLPKVKRRSVYCKTLEQILVENQDILGGKDEMGRYGSKINLISMDIEGYEAKITGCTDWSRLLSANASPQLMLIETYWATPNGMRAIDASLSMASFAKVMFALAPKGHFADDVYERQVRRRWIPPPYNRCKNASASTCSFYDVVNSAPQNFDVDCS